MSDNANYLNYAEEVLGIKYIPSKKPKFDKTLTIVFDKNLNVQEQLVFTKIIEALKLKNFSSQVLPPQENFQKHLQNLPSERVICFFKDSVHQHGIFDEEDRHILFTHSVEDLVGPNTDKELLERKKQTWGLLKTFL